MKITALSKGNNRLLLIFAGWSTDASAFEGISCPSYDILVVHDYSSFDLPPFPREYDEIVVLAWSLGVHAAEIALQEKNWPITLTIAVNGTSNPVSDTEGIPTAIYKSTAENLSAASFVKFRRRMGASGLPRGERTIESLSAELFSFPTTPIVFRWDRAVISSDDRIFPPANQANAWEGRAEITHIDGPHMPDFQKIIDSFIINKSVVSTHFAKGRETYRKAADVQLRIAQTLWQLWQKHLHGWKPQSVLEIGVGNGMFTELYAPKLKPKELILWDIAPEQSRFGCVESKDAESAIFSLSDNSLDAIASANTMQWFNSPALFLLNVSRILKSGGVAVLSTFGPKTFHELTEAGVTPLPYLSLDSLKRIIPQNIKIEELFDGLVTKVFSASAEALHHLQETGVTGRPTSQGVRHVLENYPRREDGRVSLTYQPIYLILRKQ